MILMTHAVIGAALTHQTAQYGIIFFIAFVSHYLFDMIPHWHYNVPHVKWAAHLQPGKTLTMQWRFVPDIIRVGIDLTIGVALAFLFFDGLPEAVVIGALGAVLPDILAGLAKFWPLRVLVWHDRFHRWMHTTRDLDHRPVLGISTQLAIILFFILLFR